MTEAVSIPYSKQNKKVLADALVSRIIYNIGQRQVLHLLYLHGEKHQCQDQTSQGGKNQHHVG